jgi:hypothetical protein
MKRLLDESTDELTRSLLEAGVEHRPSPGNKRQVIVALGAGGALGLFSSNAFAWLGTTAGKVTAAGVAVGVAGAVLVGAPVLRSPDAGGERVARHGVTERILAEKAAAGASGPSDEAVAEPSALGSSEDASERRDLYGARQLEESLREPATTGNVREPGAAAGEATPRARDVSERRRARKVAGARRSQPLSGRKARPFAAEAQGASAEKVAKQAADESVAEVQALAPVTQEARRAALDAEVRLVDEMRAAARRDDHDGLARLVAAYQREFPDGQLETEVADFEALLERADAP